MLVNICFLGKFGSKRLSALFCTDHGEGFLSPQRYNNYYKHKINDLSPLPKSIIEMLAQKNCNISTLKNKFDMYRQNDYPRLPRDLLVLNCAFNECSNPQVRKLAGHLIEFIIRFHDFSEFSCDRSQLTALLSQFSQKRSQSFEKIKQALVMYKLIQLLMTNQKSIAFSHFISIINLLTSNYRLTVVTSTRFLTFATIFSSKILKFINYYTLHGANNDYIEKLASQRLITSVLNYLKDFPTKTDEEAKILFEYFDKTILSKNQSCPRFKVFNIHRNFPYSNKTPQGQFYKDVILKKIIQRCKKGIDQGEDWNYGLLLYSILSFEFYKTMDSLKFRYEDELNYLTKQDLKVPQLPQFYWQTYKNDAKKIHQDHISRNIIKKIYPEKYISTPDLESSTIKPPKITQNQIKIRMIHALQKLGLKWEREVQVGGRFVDFMVQDIMIECDGDYHFDLYKMDYNESTHFRNLHILLSGYKLLIINIFQYNKHRTTDELAELLNKKLTILRKNDAVMIL